MDRAEFILTVYCLVCEHYQMIKRRYLLRRGGVAPALSEEEVIPMEVCGEYFKLPPTETSLRTVGPIMPPSFLS